MVKIRTWRLILKMIGCLLPASMISYGCFDILHEEQKNLVGNIALVNPHNQEDKGYILVFQEADFNSTILEDYVTDISGNDSMLIVRGVNKETCDDVFYKINHIKGKKPVTTISLLINEYDSLLQLIKPVYYFHETILPCR